VNVWLKEARFNDTRQTESDLLSRKMYLKPSFLPLNGDNIIYVLRDERGKLITAGTREVCELLLQMFNNEGVNHGKSEVGLLDEELVTSRM
jgi:hypothetical protein